jgi:glycosyltransferase involved in cell wall biosynthesis
MLPIERTRTGSTLPGPTPARSDPLSVALLTPYYWPEVRRGTERLVHDLANGLSAREDFPAIFAGHGSESSEAVEEGVPVIRRRASHERIPRALGYSERVGHLPGMWRRIRQEPWDVIHSFGSYEAAVASFVARRKRPARILTVTGIPREDVQAGLLWRRRALRRAVEKSDAVVLLSNAAREALTWLGGEQRVINPGVDLEAFKQTRERAEIPTLLCTAAADDPRKRLGLVLEAFRELRGQLPEARLVLSRRGSDRSALGRGEPGVELRDLDSHTALVNAYSEAWATVLVSRAEAFGLVAVESLACGTPVVGSSDAGVAEVLGEAGGHARLFTGDNPSGLAAELAAAIDLAADDGVRGTCRRRAERFSLERSVDEYASLYREAIAGRSL